MTDSVSQRHMVHYRYCNCVGDSSLCCDKNCPCHEEDALLELRLERDKKIDALIEIFEEDIRHHRFGRKTRITFHTGGN